MPVSSSQKSTVLAPSGSLGKNAKDYNISRVLQRNFLLCPKCVEAARGHARSFHKPKTRSIGIPCNTPMVLPVRLWLHARVVIVFLAPLPLDYRFHARTGIPLFHSEHGRPSVGSSAPPFQLGALGPTHRRRCRSTARGASWRLYFARRARGSLRWP